MYVQNLEFSKKHSFIKEENVKHNTFSKKNGLQNSDSLMLWEKDTVDVGKYDVRVDLNVYFDGKHLKMFNREPPWKIVNLLLANGVS